MISLPISCQPDPFRTLVINTVGEPGCGKTTLSFWLCQALKHAGVVVEFVPEVVKYECFTVAGRKRVSSGSFDGRYLAQQSRLFFSVAGQVQVLVNDGAFELSIFYAQRRMNGQALQSFKDRAEGLIHRKNMQTDQIFVAPSRSHVYEKQGRIESDSQAAQMRNSMLSYISEEFGFRVKSIENDTQRQDFLDMVLKRLKDKAGDVC